MFAVMPDDVLAKDHVATPEPEESLAYLETARV